MCHRLAAAILRWTTQSQWHYEKEEPLLLPYQWTTSANYAHVLSSSLPMKSLQAAPKGFVRWTFSLPGIWHWATASSGMYGYRWLFAIVSNKMKMIKPQTWCKMKNSIWTIVPNILIYCMHFCTFNLRYIWNKVNLRPLHCFFLNSYLCPASFLLCCFAILINPTNVTLYCDIKDTNCSQGAN